MFAIWCLKAHERAPGFGEVDGTRWVAWMKAMRSWGLLLFLVPLATFYICMTLARLHRDIIFIGPDGLWLAIAVTAGVLWFSVVTMATALSGPPYRPRFLALAGHIF
jgi:hypothetical protein